MLKPLSFLRNMHCPCSSLPGTSISWRQYRMFPSRFCVTDSIEPAENLQGRASKDAVPVFIAIKLSEKPFGGKIGADKIFFETMPVAKEQFEKWVVEAIDSVPEKFREKINNLTFFVEDYPTAEQLKKARLLGRGGVLLLGLYEGYHQSQRLNIGPVFPDRITLFQKPLESLSQTEAELKKQIFQTVHHEIAHHFGSDEPGARKAGKIV